MWNNFSLMRKYILSLNFCESREILHFLLLGKTRKYFMTRGKERRLLHLVVKLLILIN
jgi:hypothetical protein